MKMNHTRNALFTSVLALLLCVSMLVGTTFAWFTDSVTSGVNQIVAGNLDVQLFHEDKGGSGEVSSTTTLFDDVEKWEPGAMAWEKLTVKNNGTLALKYNLTVNASDVVTVGGKSLLDVLKVAVLDAAPTRDSIKGATLTALKDFALNYNNKPLTAGASESVYIAIYWAPAANDNDYNLTTALKANLGVSLVATQYTSEGDSFNDQYDADANYPAVSIVTGSAAMTLGVNDAPSATTKKTTVDVPADVFNDGDEVGITVDTENSLFNVSADGAVVGSLDVVMTVNGAQHEAELTGGKTFVVTTYISTGLADVAVAYTGTDGRAQPTNVQYEPATGKLTFETTHFSEYEVSGKAVAYDTEMDAAYTTADAVVEALKSEEAKVEIAEDLTASQKVELATKIEVAGSEIKADTTIVEDINNTLDVDSIAKVADIEALKTAIANGGAILLTEDITVEETILVEKDVELDLGGKTLAANVNKARALKLNADGVDFVLNAANSNVTFGNGTYGIIDIAADLNGASVTVNDGTFAGTSDGGAIVKLRNGANHEVTLNNVTYTENAALVPGMINAFLLDTHQKVVENYTVTINGGTYDLCAGICVTPNVKLVMNGVTMSSKGSAVEAGNAVITNCVFNVNPGLYTGSIDASAVSVNNNGNVIVKDTEINSERYGLCITSSGGTITAEDCTIKAKSGNVNYAGENGKVNFKGQPVAWVEELENLNIKASQSIGGTARDLTLECGYTFLPTQSEEECKESGYANWHADFVISFDKDVENVAKAGLAGYYSAWCDGYNDGNWFSLDVENMPLKADDEIRLVAGMLDGTTVSYGEICKYAIREENSINGFLCGAYADETLSNVTMTVELRLYEIDETQSTQSTVDCETGKYIVISQYSHTFD